MLHTLLTEFVHLVGENQMEIYNEFSLQHELGIFLRSRLPDYKVQFERNTSYFRIFRTIKHEIDIVVFNDTEKYAIELKFPQNGKYPEQMFSFVKDIRFMEQLKNSGFTNTYCMTLVYDRAFYQGPTQDGIYAYFRNGKPVGGTITKPTGAKNETVTLDYAYPIQWKHGGGKLMYYIVDLKNDSI